LSNEPGSDEKARSAKLLRLLGLGVRGRGAIVGVNQVRQAAQRGKLHLAIAAADASDNSLDKTLPLLKAKNIKVLIGPGTTELGNAVGREKTAVVGVVDRRLADGIRALFPSAPPKDSEEEQG
jgi:ribosomal protein L7Ae-like RNA K-turn-binding protein